ncbi:MAG: capsular biosynthesis protein [Lachnospiraceae bacterium]|nr:capsular biosynthesis protein [Lachnospiraceae bacterium]
MENGRVISDLHCHILPGIDDGAKDAAVSEAILDAEARDGVTQILFTPHFYADHIEQDRFLRRRGRAFEKVSQLCEERGIATALGAEVRIKEQLLGMDLSPLRMGDTEYLLLEWPFYGGYPLYGEEIVRNLLKAGIRPVFAHIERYEHLFLDEDRLRYFMDKGCIFQVNTATVLDPRTQKRLFELANKGFVHILCTDAHNMDSRPPKMGEALALLEKKTSREIAARILQNGDDLFHGRTVHVHDMPKKKKLFGLF